MKRPMFIIGFVYIFALAIFQSIPEKNLVFVLTISAIVCAAIIIIPSTRKNKFTVLSAITLTFAASVSFANFKINIEPIQNYDGREEIISGIINEVPYEKNGSLHYNIKVDYVKDETVKPFNVAVSSSVPLECDFGDRLYCTTHFYTPQSSYFFDSKQYYRAQGVYINAYIKNPNETYAAKSAENSLRYKIIKLRTKMLEASKNFLTPAIANIQNGIFLGERNSIENSQRIILLKNGIYHLICTSGIHISIIIAGFLWCFKKLKFSQKLSNLTAIIPVFTFILLTGFNLSAVRAGIMCIVYLLGMAFSKDPDSLSSLGLSVFLICLVSPNAALSLGLWLSALSILGITLFNRKIFLFLSGRFNKKLSNNPVVKTIISAVSISLSAGFLTAPLTIFYSKIFSIIQIFTNIIFIPLTTIILIFSLILSIFWVFGVPKLIMYPFAFVSGISVKLFIKLAEFFAKIPFCYISLDYPFIKFWIGLTVLTIAICLIIFKHKKALVFSIIIPVTALICGIFSYKLYNFNRAQISVINGSESIACVIRKNGHTACISCFGEKNYTKNFENLLECSNISDIDYFAVVSSENLPEKFIKNTLANHKTNCFILPSDNSEYISPSDSNISPIYFDTELHSAMWDEQLKIDAMTNNDCTYTNIKIDGLNILIIPNGGNADDVPDSIKNCNILLSYGTAKNLRNISCDSTIIYGPQYVVSESIPKTNKNAKVYNLAYYGKLSITPQNNNYKIGV